MLLDGEKALKFMEFMENYFLRKLISYEFILSFPAQLVIITIGEIVSHILSEVETVVSGRVCVRVCGNMYIQLA